MATLTDSLYRFECLQSDDDVKRDLELTCVDCGTVLCDVEAGDNLGTLARVADEHTCPEEGLIELRVENHYPEDGDVITTTPTASVTIPRDDDDLDEWAEEQLMPLTGTGRTEGESSYFVEITKFDARPDLVGHEFEFGV